MDEFSQTNICNFPTSELPARYGVVSSVVYTRLKALHIKPQKHGKKSYINNDQVQLMDDLHAHLKAGGKTNEFLQTSIASGKIVPVLDSALVTQMPSRAMTTSSQPQKLRATVENTVAPTSNATEALKNPTAQKVIRISAKNPKKVDERAQYSAAEKLKIEETLTLLYETTEEFTIPGLKEKLKQHREKCNQVRLKRTMEYNIEDFLPQSILLKIKAFGSNDSTK